MKTYNFSITLNNIKELTGKLEDALFEAGCDDALLSRTNGITSLEFYREGESLLGAVNSAIKDLKKCKVEIVIGNIENQ